MLRLWARSAADMTRKLPALQVAAVQFLLGIAGLSLITIVCLQLGFGITRTALFYIILLAVVSLLGSFSTSLVLSVIGAACLNYFFAPPLFTFRVDAQDDIVRIVTFVMTSLVVTTLITRLRASETRFRTFVDHANDAFFLLDDDLTVVDVNQQACEGLGYSKEELIGKNPSDFDVGLDERSIQHLKQRILSGEKVTFETRHRRRDGSSFPVEVRVSQFDQGGRRLLCLVRDITERKLAEHELNASEQRFRSFVDYATDGFFLFDEHQVLVEVNRQACESLGYSREEMIGMHPRDFDAALDETSLAQIGERVKAGETVEFESLHQRKDGTVFPVEVRARQFQLGAQRFRLSLARNITERKSAEKEIRKNEARLQKAQAIAHFGWWERDFTTNQLSFSDEVPRIFGSEHVDLPEAHERWLRLIHPDDRARITESAAAALVPGGPRYDVEYRIVRPDSTERIIYSQGDVTWDDSGRPQRQFGFLQDITELRQAEQELRDSEERFRTLVEFSFDVYWETDAHHRFTRQVFAERLTDAPTGGSEIGRTRWEIPSLEPDAEAWRKHREMLDAHLPFRDFELARPTPDGGKRYVSVSGLPVFDRSGRYVGYRGVGRHITERKKVEEALRRSEAYLAEAQRLSHTGTVAFTATGPVYWSEESYQIWGLDPQDGLPLLETVLNRVHPDDREIVKVEVDEASSQKRTFGLEFRIVLPDGTVKNIQSTGRPLFSADGNLAEMVATLVDVTDRKRAAEALRRSENYLTEAQRLSNTGSWAFDPLEDRMVYCSKELFRVYGMAPRQDIPTIAEFMERIHPEDRDRVRQESIERVGDNLDHEMEYRLLLPDGTLKYVQSIRHATLDSSGEVIEVIGTIIDVTERKRAQEEHERLRQLEADLAHVNRVSILGEMAATLAHELLHPVATARNNARAAARFLEMSPPELNEVKDALDCIVRDADRAKDIVGRIRTHMKKTPPQYDWFDLNHAISEVIVMVQSSVEKSGVLVHTQLQSGLLRVHGDRVQVQQVVLNLILNAIEAMAAVEKSARKLSISTEQTESGGVLVTIRDSGPGIEAEKIEQVFLPFYTTKASGMGMGLSICQSIIAAHGGRLWAEANQTVGAQFQFSLPPNTDS
jgi:PAS domain S-box-containing protein